MFYKLEIQGIVYLVDPKTAYAYTYDPISPTLIGSVEWENPSNPPKIKLKESWKDIMQAKLTNMTPSYE